MSRNHDIVTILILVLFFGIPLLFLYVKSQISKFVDRESTEKAKMLYAGEKRSLEAEIEEKKRKVEKELEQKNKELERKIENFKKDAEIQNKLFEEKTKGFPWVAEQYAYYKTEILKANEEYLRNKKHPATAAAETVKECRRKAKESEKKAFIYQGLIAYYEAILPEQDILDITDDILRGINLNDISDDGEDVAKKFVTSEEWKNLTKQEKFQAALNGYWKRQKSKWEIGRDYERMVGYEYEEQSFDVTFFGAIKGLQDLGRDLIVKKGKKTQIIQCKNWSADKLIHEKHILQLFGTCTLYDIENKSKTRTEGLFITSCTLSEKAKACAEYLGIKVVEGKKFHEYPSVKCNIGRNGEKIYHLPFDQQYDKIKIAPCKGEMYCRTVKVAEENGFRRAFRWHGEN